MFRSLFSPRPNRKPVPQKTRLAFEKLEDRATPALAVTPLGAGLTAQQMAQSLVGSGVTISNVTYSTSNQSSGTFTGGTPTIGFDAGVVLSTGSAAAMTATSNTTTLSSSLGGPGDAQLTTLSGFTTLDASVLQFSFIAKGASVNFSYVFASEEYEEYVGQSFNDVFGFFINGKQVSLVPGTNLPVGVDTVNQNINTASYRSNTSGTRPYALDGQTVVFNNTFSVTPNAVNTFRFAIADATDGALDSYVFIKAGSISSPQIKVTNPLRFVYDAKTKRISGYITVQNTGTGDLPGTNYLIVKVAGMTLVNASGVGKNGERYRTLGTLGAGKTYKVLLTLTNPLKKPVGSYFFNSANVTISSTKP